MPSRLTRRRSSRPRQPRCLAGAYIFLQPQTPARIVLYGQSRDGGGGIPAVIVDLTHQSRAVRYRVVA